MADIGALSTGLTLAEDGIWYASGAGPVSYPEESNEACHGVEAGSFWFRHRNDCILAAVKSFPPAGTIFDVGGGNGFVAVGLAGAGFDVALVEPGRAGAVNAKNRGVRDVVCASADTARFKPRSLPAVGLFDVIEHMEDDLGFLRKLETLMQPGGRLYATVPAYPFLWSADDVEAGHFRRYALGSITRVLSDAGFRIDYASCIFRLLPLPSFLMRTVPYRLGLVSARKPGDRLPHLHATGGGLAARMIGRLLQPEVRNIAQGKVMAFGASCLVVASSSASRS